MPKKFVTSIDMSGLEIQNVRAQSVAGDPGSPVEAQFWYDSVAKKFKWRTDATVIDPTARGNHTGTQLASTISDLASTVKLYRLDEFAVPTADVNVNNRKITNLGTPTAASDAATKGYVDGLITGLDWKPSVKVAVSTNVNIASPGTPLDGIAMTNGDLVLLYGQSTGSQNGPWVWNGAASAMTRPSWWGGSIATGAVMPVEQGSSADKLAVMTNDTAVTVDSTASAFTIIGAAGSSYTAGNGLTESPAGTFNVGAGTGISVTADAIALDPAVAVRKFNQVLSTSATSYVVNHGLNNQWATVAVVENSGSFREVDAEVQHTDANNITVLFANAPSANAYRVIVQG